MIGDRILLAFLVLSGAVMTGAEARSQTFDGITIIELAADEAGRKAILGYLGGGGFRYIVTFVSAQGTYAAVGDRDRRSCVAWAQAGSYTGGSITFGLPPSEQSMKLARPSICLPFTLRYEGPATVRVEATNKFEPLRKNAQIVRYSRKRKVIARIPLIAFDWGLPVFSRYNIKRVKLGPLPALTAELGGNADVNLSELQSTRFGKIKIFSVTMHEPSDGSDTTAVYGRVVAAEVMGWPWDVLYDARYSERLPQRSFTEAFDRAVVERYGEPSLRTQGRGASAQVYFWFFDLDGRQSTIDDVAPGNCLATWEHWKGGGKRTGVEVDMGPWGCALVMRLTHNGGRGSVGKYSVETTSGYAMALNHFLGRLEEMRVKSQKIQQVQSSEPKL